jgi:MtfA peptidase
MTVETFLLICLAAILCAGAIYLVRSRLKASHRKKLFDKALTRAQIAIIIENVSLYRKLPKKFQQELHGCIQIFLDSKEFVGCSEVQITEEIQLTVAANACLLLLTRNIRDFPGFKTILIYPDTYHVPQTSQKGDLEVRHVSGRAGESWYRGPIVLSWGDVIRGSKNEEDGFNVVLHEFAHKLDEQNAVMDGLPILREENSYSEWAEVLSEEYKKFQTRVSQGKNRVIDSYGATSPVEFFAVATESFFEKPTQMQRRLPKLYKQLSDFYGVDPANW